jgi:hypothetical protein
MREAFLLGIDHDVDVALIPSRYGLRDVRAGLAEAHASKQRFEVDRTLLVDREFDELRSEATRARGKPRLQLPAARVLLLQLIEYVDQRPVSVDRYASGRSGAELIVEYLEREQAIITR